MPRPGHKKVPRPTGAQKGAPPPDQSSGAPFCAPVGAGLVPSEEDTLLSFSARVFITLAEETGVVFIGHYSSLGIYEDKI